jgi:L-ascorbate metabolism protein UlaG (beta-lactamase superfamily)
MSYSKTQGKEWRKMDKRVILKNKTMKRWVAFVLVGIVLLVGGFFALNSYIYNEKQGDGKTTMDTTVSPTSDILKVTPISHATMVFALGGQVIYTDPIGGGSAFAGQQTPSIILVTDIHGDHLDAPTLKEIAKADTVIIAPQAVVDTLPDDMAKAVIVMKNGDKITQKGIEIEAIPMYNVPESESAAHTKGRGNGYVLNAEGKRVYIAGDTGATPEMKALKNIDVAFIPMNLPYTMSIEEAAEGVLAFKPKVVHPYHYRGSDVQKFKQLVEAKDANIKVELLEFYPAP